MARRFFSWADLLKRGWAKPSIYFFLGAPDERRELAYSQTMSCFDVNRVLEAEKHWLFQSVAGLAESEQRQRLVDFAVGIVRECVIRVEYAALDELVAALNERDRPRDAYFIDPRRGIPDFLEEKLLDLIRHNLTDYDEILSILKTRFGERYVDTEIYLRVRMRTWMEIGNAYPEFLDACQRKFLWCLCRLSPPKD